MPFGDYASLQDEIISFLDRGDVATRVPGWIRLFEAQAIRILQDRSAQKRSTASLSSQYITLPDDFGEARGMQLNTDPVTVLDSATPEQLKEISLQGEITGTPTHYAISGTTIEFAPVPSGTFTLEMRYVASVPRLSDANTSNWLLLKYPDAYFYGALSNALAWLKDDERAAQMGTVANQILEDIRVANERSERGGAPLRVRFRNAY